MRIRLRVIAVTLVVAAGVLLFWPWHRTYEVRHVTCGPTILALFPTDPTAERGAERRASDKCLSFARKSAGIGIGLFSIGGYLMIRANRDRYPASQPLKPA